MGTGVAGLTFSRFHYPALLPPPTLPSPLPAAFTTPPLYLPSCPTAQHNHPHLPTPIPALHYHHDTATSPPFTYYPHPTPTYPHTPLWLLFAASHPSLPPTDSDAQQRHSLVLISPGLHPSYYVHITFCMG